MKKAFLSLLVLVLAVTLTVGCSCSKKDKKGKNSSVINDNSNVVVGDKKLEGLDIVDFVVIYDNGISDIFFTIENNTDENVTHDKIECSMYNKNKELLYSFTRDVGSIEAMDLKEITYRVNLDLTKVADVEYVFK